MESVGFKEWALVCDALGRGEPSIIVRKGGIAEGRAGFSFRHREFFLFPTFFHGQVDQIRTPGAQIPAERDGEIEIRYFARVESARLVAAWATAAALEPFHVLKEAVVRERFEYEDAPGVHVAFVRLSRLSASWRFADERRYRGCRSWVELPPLPANITLQPVLTDDDHAARREAFCAIVREQA